MLKSQAKALRFQEASSTYGSILGSLFLECSPLRHTLHMNQLKKLTIVFGGHLIFMNIPLRKEDSGYICYIVQEYT